MSLLADSNEQQTVIDISQLSSDIEAEDNDSSARDDEINLLGEHEFVNNNNSNSSHDHNLTVYKGRYREVVHAIRRLNRKLETERQQHERLEQELKKQIAASRSKTADNHKNQSSDSISLMNVASEGEIANKHNSHRQSSKLRDLEKLMAKCKESLKAKNQQLTILKDSLLEVDKFKDYIGGFKDELRDLRQAHETWTLSIAENKRVMHQEIESKNLEIDKLRAEIKDSNNKSIQLKTYIQSLESRLVSTSAAHQKERESLTKELVASKNNAIKQIQKDHGLLLERVKLDLERSIENLKLEVLVKDEQIIRNAEREQELNEQSCSLRTDLENAKCKLKEALIEVTELRSIRDDQANEIAALKRRSEAIEIQNEDNSSLKTKSEELGLRNEQLGSAIKELESKNQELRSQNEKFESSVEELELRFKNLETKNQEVCSSNQVLEKTSQESASKSQELTSRIQELELEIRQLVSENQRIVTKNQELDSKNRKLLDQVDELIKKIASVEETNVELEHRLKQSEQAVCDQDKQCAQCEELRSQIGQEAERYEQSSFELKTKLDLMTTANSDQEKVLQDLKVEREKAIESFRTLRLEYDELTKKNETISQVIQENEVEMSNLLEKLLNLTSTKQQLEASRRENSSLSSSLAQANSELNDRVDDLTKSQQALDELRKRLAAFEQEAKSISQSAEALKQEKRSLLTDLAAESKRRTDLEQQLVVSILAAMKNLDTPDTSPVSDKNYKSSNLPGSDGATNQERNLPDPVRLAEELSSLALDRSTAYMTSNQRLQAVLLDYNMINEEIKRLKEELNALNREKTNEVMNSLEEVDRLRIENQALVHDQKAYDDQVASLENEIEQLKSKLPETVVVEQAKSDATTITDDDLIHLLELREEEIEQLRQAISDQQRAEQQAQCQTAKVPDEDVPDPTEFKYLKNIVYQFMMGREPTTLARVISAVFKFEQEQVEQICKVQEAIHQVAS